VPQSIIQVPFGPIGICWDAGALTAIDLDPVTVTGGREHPSGHHRTSRRVPEAGLTPLGLRRERLAALVDQERDRRTVRTPEQDDVVSQGPGEEGLSGVIHRQLNEYFESRATDFDLPLALQGTLFQRRLWAELIRIPFGQTRTYGEIARLLGSSPRAVGQACRANPCPIVVPCHRVVAIKGLGGFAGDTSGRKLAVKRWLLDHEGVGER
jgi:methylated-DNA-[protein]-cysteine S-methyltransferase